PGWNAPQRPAADVLEVDVPDAVRSIAGECDRVEAAERQVPGVEAEPHLTAREDALDVVGPLDQRADVRMDDVLERLLRRDLLDPCEPVEDGAPAGGVERN